MLTGMERCEVADCRFNKNSNCVLKMISISEEGFCNFMDFIEKEKPRDYIDSSECDSVEILSEREEWISTQFKFLKKGFTFRLSKLTGEPITINNENEFITTSDAFVNVLDSNEDGIPIYRVNIYVNS